MVLNYASLHTSDVRFSEIETRTEIANALNVDVKALDLVKLLSTTCKTESCNYPAEYLAGWDILCQQSWFTRQFNKNGKPLKNCRGHGLYGPQFMSKWLNKSSPTTCCCEMPLCEEIGYSHHGMFALPTDPKMRREAIRVLGIKTPEKINNLLNRGGWVCPWHYRKDHRVWRDVGGN